MSSLRLILASLLYHGRSNLAVACGVAVGTAVLTGALLVGDSMQGSLRRLTLDGRGCVNEALVADHFFREKLADEPTAVPVILLRASLENPKISARANRVELVGCDDRFWRLGTGRPPRLPGRQEIVLNQPLADRLGARVGDAVLLRLPRPAAIPGDSALGRKHETVRTQRLVVSRIIAAEGLGRFGLRPNQQTPRNAYVPLDWLQERLDQSNRVNAILATDQNDNVPNSRRLTASGTAPDCSDYSLHVERTPLGYWNITSDRMMFDPATERELSRALNTHLQPTLTYLANTLACNGYEVPYSTITALDFADEPPLGPFLSTDGKPLAPLGPDEIVLNSWAADQLHAKVGDTVRVTYFEPESVEGQVREKTVALRLAAVVQLAGAAADRALTPTVQGMTEELTMADWDPPFPFDAKRIRPADERYWDRHGPTPKAFVALATGRRLWGSRFGQTTSFRVVEGPGLRERLLQRLDPAAMGLVFQPVKRQGLEASVGATPFNVLFLCFSFFIIVAAVMLVALLFRLGIDRRAAQVGVLLAVGLSRRQVGRLLMGEGLVVAAAGSLLGVPAGIGYAALMLLGLQTWWLAAIVTPFLHLHLTTTSLVIGYLSGLIAALAAIGLSVRRIGHIPPRRLLAGQTRRASPLARHLARHRRHPAWMGALLVLLAAVPTAGLLAGRIGEELRAGVFFAAAAVALIALIALVWLLLSTGTTGPAVSAGRGNLLRMALRNAARNPGRSTLTIGLVAAASFLIVAVSAFRVDPSRQTPTLHGGDGGFDLVAESDQPIFQNLNTLKDLDGDAVFSLRVHSGDDASCLNLYRPRQPRVLGVPRRFIERDGFAWTNRLNTATNPWTLLDQPPRRDADGVPRVPVILEKNTANYSLHLWGGLGETFEMTDDRRQTIRFEVVALLSNSIFQGDLLIGEPAFLRLFPETSGYRFFLVETPPSQTAAARNTLERDFGDYGLSAETTGRRLADFLAVQNTYLSTFQSLGGLGLLLGTLGLAVVQLRNVLERRGELALLRATGFRRATLAWLVLLEHALLLAAGLAIGTAAALLAVLPHLLDRAASLPWASLAGTLTIIWAMGLAVGVFAVRAAVGSPLPAALREERT